jgi:hypothetical protein
VAPLKHQETTTPTEPVSAQASPPRTVVYSPETTAAYGALIESGLRGNVVQVFEALRHLATMVHCDFTGELRLPHTHTGSAESEEGAARVTSPRFLNEESVPIPAGPVRLSPLPEGFRLFVNGNPVDRDALIHPTDKLTLKVVSTTDRAHVFETEADLPTEPRGSR